MTDERLAIIERTISTTAPTWMDVVCAELVAEVRRLQAITNPPPPFSAGDRVRVESFAGTKHEGVVDHYDAPNRIVWVLIKESPRQLIYVSDYLVRKL